jgi:hypothetical protein
MIANAAAFLKTLFAAILLCFGLALWGVAILIVAIALILTISGWESLDGPIIWGRVIGIVILPAMIGFLLVAFAVGISSTRDKGLK